MSEPIGHIGLTHFPVKVLGPGSRAGIWFQGCSRGCAECMAPHTWNRDAHPSMALGELTKFLQSYSVLTTRLTISGGEPFEQPEFLRATLGAARSLGYSDIMVYSSFLHDDLAAQHADVLELIDVLIDGPYMTDQPTRLVWRGSANQRLVVLSRDTEIRSRYAPCIDENETQVRIQVVHQHGQTFVLGIPRDPLDQVLHG